MSAQFKAPWKWCIESAMTNPPKPLGISICSADGYFICSMPLGREDIACKMAAAPELLAALILMVRTHDEPAESLLQEVKEQQWLEKARAAIAKAIGEQS